MSFCQSCTAPLDNPEFKGSSDIYCKYCTDDTGKLKSYEEIKQGIASWFKGWQGDISDEEVQKRAEFFMKAMPAWAEE